MLFRIGFISAQQRPNGTKQKTHTPYCVLSFLRRLHLLLSAGAPVAVDRYLLPGGRSAANPPAAVAAVDQ